ncbi:hypothetical protein BB561_000505 [Smittium simulii]|uniref:Phosducin domain-containing protein n=1 Tax=Smittium simulii TaxID=133385 RepID=A0A2T9YYW9_9FUNG|nr:hypothetical protein BB561_000505 [Smittium simulii]
MQDPNEDTEWNDALRKHKIIPEKPKEITDNEIYDMLVEQRQEEEANKHRDMDMEELEELLFDDRILETYRNERLAALSAETSKAKFGSLNYISETEYAKEITEASKSAAVVAHLFDDSLELCTLVNRVFEELAKKYCATKFVAAKGTRCIKNYPLRNMPTILVYLNGDLRQQLVGVSQLGGENMKAADMEKFLKELGAVED